MTHAVSVPDPSEANGTYQPAALGLSGSGRWLLLLLNAWPLLQSLVLAAVLIGGWAPLGWRVASALGLLFLLPPLLARGLLAARPIREGTIPVGRPDFFTWWALLSLQGLFNRFPFFEEALRLVPGLYSFWLRLWGARIGRLTFWSAGTVILDRPFIRIGDDVVFGAGVRINPHVLARDAEGRTVLTVGTVAIGHRALVGGYSLLTAGTSIAPDASTRALLISPPFTRWEANSLRKKSPPGE
jgi:hypothetical protein